MTRKRLDRRETERGWNSVAEPRASVQSPWEPWKGNHPGFGLLEGAVAGVFPGHWGERLEERGEKGPQCRVLGVCGTRVGIWESGRIRVCPRAGRGRSSPSQRGGVKLQRLGVGPLLPGVLWGWGSRPCVVTEVKSDMIERPALWAQGRRRGQMI